MMADSTGQMLLTMSPSASKVASPDVDSIPETTQDSPAKQLKRQPTPVMGDVLLNCLNERSQLKPTLKS